MTDQSYVFEGTAHDSELDRLRLIESVFDPGSRRVLARAGIAHGVRCLEIGAGAGSIARWMGKEVGTTGKIAAVDIDTRFLATTPGENVDVVEGDIRTVDLAPGWFQVAHARFVFIHLAAFLPALEAALRFLAPGGYLVLEKPDFSVSRALAGDPLLRASFDRVHQAVAAMFASRNMDHAFGLRLPAVMEAAGLEVVAVENDVPVARGGDPLAKMMGLSTLQLREKYLATGQASEVDIDHYGHFAVDPSCWAIHHGTVRAVARKPAASRAAFTA